MKRYKSLYNEHQDIGGKHNAPPTAALYALFPFANAIREDFASADEFQFNAPKYVPIQECSVSTQFAPSGDGFAILNVAKKNDQRELEVGLGSGE